MKVATYDGSLPEGVMVEEDTDPWVEVDGQPVDWSKTVLERRECPCEDWGPVFLPGVLDSMNSPYGIQRCDACSIHDGDLDAALALARLVGGVVRYYVEEDE